MRGKALENGTEGDVVNVMNLQSKRTLSGTVTGRGQVSITSGRRRALPQTSDATSSLGTHATRARCRRHRQFASRSKSRVM